MDTSTDAPAAEKPVKRKVKRKVRKARSAAEPAPVKADGIFTGLTVADCCDGCNVDGCVISGKPYCAHPRKGGLQSQDIQRADALRRQQQAKRILSKQMLEARDA